MPPQLLLRLEPLLGREVQPRRGGVDEGRELVALGGEVVLHVAGGRVLVEPALAVARALERSPHVDAVVYPGLASHKRNELAYRSLSAHARAFVDGYVRERGDAAGGFPYGGMISFRIRGGAAEADKFLTSARLFTLAESLGGVESLAELPAQMTHGSIPPAERALLGIGDNLIRLSVGVEEEEDLVADVEQALEAAASLSKDL